MESLVVYSRKSERVPEEKIAEIFSHIPDHCVTREDFEWTDLDCERWNKSYFGFKKTTQIKHYYLMRIVKMLPIKLFF